MLKLKLLKRQGIEEKCPMDCGETILLHSVDLNKA